MHQARHFAAFLHFMSAIFIVVRCLLNSCIYILCPAILHMSGASAECTIRCASVSTILEIVIFDNLACFPFDLFRGCGPVEFAMYV